VQFCILFWWKKEERRWSKIIETRQWNGSIFQLLKPNLSTHLKTLSEKILTNQREITFDQIFEFAETWYDIQREKPTWKGSRNAKQLTQNFQKIRKWPQEQLLRSVHNFVHYE